MQLGCIASYSPFIKGYQKVKLYTDAFPLVRRAIDAPHGHGHEPVLNRKVFGTGLNRFTRILDGCLVCVYIYTGWWFGTFFYFPIVYGNVIIPIDEFIFFRGVGWNHQPAIHIHTKNGWLIYTLFSRWVFGVARSKVDTCTEFMIYHICFPKCGKPNVINQAENHHFHGCYKPSPNGKVMALGPKFWASRRFRS